MSTFNILRRHRAVLLFSAVLVAPLAAGVALNASLADTQTGPSPVGSTISASATSYAPIVAADKPAVVTITSIVKTSSAPDDQIQPSDSGLSSDERLPQFFGNRGIPAPKAPPQGATQLAEALGSGFIISSDGTIVTNNHVIDGASDIMVTLDDGTELQATLVGHDAKSDLAVLKVKAGKPLPTIAWGNSDGLRAGDPILAIGNPFGIGTTVTAGIVSARGRDLNSGPYDDFLQIDAPINHGNSGGPLVDTRGAVVGINTAIYSPNGGSVGVGFAIPSNEAKQIVAKLVKNGSIEHGLLGIEMQPITADLANALGLPTPEGALVAHVGDGSPAAHAGIETGDVITGFAGQTIKEPKTLSRAVADLSPGKRETLSVWRDGKTVALSVVVGGNDDSVKQVAAINSSQPMHSSFPTLGLALGDLDLTVRQALNVPSQVRGAVVEGVDPDQPAATSGIELGDIIISVNRVPVQTAKETSQAISAATKSSKKLVLLLIKRGEQQTFIAVPYGNG
ncbi:Do family serine endopeptidase [Mesorhizobium sp. YC-39]|uniref:Do family serine endopeptidase n=1 Tax=unclassified Mesorhizobium TaxID=325217 RepID=UPI0021E94CF0|nr:MULTISPECIES: Do family serine endopeptidase [unclassified Mesorhizobium]MCV3206501.1 Do family serine endopeptidase [Mesorhizobium sp. YC-2]MCV3227099.1 Do family serine endopeptidase [Mesorhizobium sp. YC-39]